MKFEVVDSMDEAFRGADIVIPKSWGCLDTMGTKPEESLRIAKQYRHWICDAAKMKLTRPDSLYMHPLPADRGNEVTDEVIDGPHSVVFARSGKSSAHRQGDHGSDHGGPRDRIRNVCLRLW